ncbi:hypothetical protein [Azospirillum sp. ST 5-10]
MTDIIPPAAGPSRPPRQDLAAAAPPGPRAPEWPRLTRSEVRRIVLDVLG